MFLGLSPYVGFLPRPINALFGYLRITASNFSVELILIIGLLAGVLFWEQRPLGSIGIVKPKLIDLPLGIATVIVILIADGIWRPIVRPLVGDPSAFNQMIRALPPTFGWAIVGSIVNALCEEFYWRGYATERVGEISRSLLVGGTVGLLADLYCHVGYWGFPYAVSLAAIQGTLTLLYLWRRSVVPGVIAHAFLDIPFYPALMTSYVIAGILMVVPSIFVPGSVYRWQAMRIFIFDEATALADLDLAIKKNSKDAEAHEWRSHIYFGALNRDKAAGNGVAAAADRKRAFDDLDLAVTLDPNNPDYYESRGWSYYLDGKYSAAVSDATRALSLDRNQSWTYHVRGAAYYALGDCGNALPDLKRYTDSAKNDILDSDAVNDLEDIAVCAISNHDLSLATIAVNEAVAGVQEHRLSPRSDPFVYRAIVENWKGEYQKEHDDLVRALAVDPNSSAALNDLADLLSNCPQAKYRDGKKAIEYAKRACELTSWRDPFEIETLAASYAESGDFTLAVKWETKAIALLTPPDRTNALLRLQLYQNHKPWRVAEHSPPTLKLSGGSTSATMR
jgi:tetratricopeptide (TPR) repeat protein/membrane protease YdiL (CAAX protease family)